MKIVVVTGSPHKAGTSALLADKFIEGAESKGHEVFRFNAAFEDIHPCRGCDACGMNGPCVQKDAIEEKLIQKLVDCDMIVLVTPLYYFGFSLPIYGVAGPGTNLRDRLRLPQRNRRHGIPCPGPGIRKESVSDGNRVRRNSNDWDFGGSAAGTEGSAPYCKKICPCLCGPAGIYENQLAGAGRRRSR